MHYETALLQAQASPAVHDLRAPNISGPMPIRFEIDGNSCHSQLSGRQLSTHQPPQGIQIEDTRAILYFFVRS